MGRDLEIGMLSDDAVNSEGVVTRHLNDTLGVWCLSFVVKVC